MASLSTSWFFIFTAFTLLTFFPKITLASDPPSSSSFSFKTFGKDLTFEPSLALYGDAKVAEDGSLVQLTAGKVIYKKPIKLLQGNPRKMTSFSTYFTFSMLKPSGGPVDGLAFFMAPGNFNGSVLGSGNDDKMKIRVVAVEFDTHKDGEHGGMSFVSVTGSNVSSVSYTDLVPNGGEKLQCWIDYEAASKKLEVRLSRYGESRPVDSIVSCSIDLSRVLNRDGEVFVGLSSANRRSRSCYVYSWSFKVRIVPRWMHSEPLDPKVFVSDVDNVKPVVEVHRKSDCVLRMLGSMVFGTACGALGAFVVLCLWTVFGSQRQVAPEEFSVQVSDFGFDKVKVVVDSKDVGEGDGKK